MRLRQGIDCGWCASAFRRHSFLRLLAQRGAPSESSQGLPGPNETRLIRHADLSDVGRHDAKMLPVRARDVSLLRRQGRECLQLAQDVPSESFEVARGSPRERAQHRPKGRHRSLFVRAMQSLRKDGMAAECSMVHSQAAGAEPEKQYLDNDRRRDETLLGLGEDYGQTFQLGPEALYRL